MSQAQGVAGICICCYFMIKSCGALVLIAGEFCEENDEFSTQYRSKFSLTSDSMKQYKRCWAVVAVILMIILIPLFIMALVNEYSFRYYLIFPIMFLGTLNFIRIVFYFGRQQEEMEIQQELPKKIQNSQKQANWNEVYQIPVQIPVVSVPQQQYVVQPNQVYVAYPQVPPKGVVFVYR